MIFLSIAIVFVSAYFAVQKRFEVNATFLHAICAAGAFSACGLAGLFYGWQNAMFPLNLGWILAAASGIYLLYKRSADGTHSTKARQNSHEHEGRTPYKW